MISFGAKPLSFWHRKRAGIERRCAGAAGSQGKAKKMTEEKRKLDDYYPKWDEVEAAIAQARIMRAKVLSDAVSRSWNVLRRNIGSGMRLGNLRHA
jgi:hypothetical protein